MEAIILILFYIFFIMHSKSAILALLDNGVFANSSKIQDFGPDISRYGRFGSSLLAWCGEVGSRGGHGWRSNFDPDFRFWTPDPKLRKKSSWAFWAIPLFLCKNVQDCRTFFFNLKFYDLRSGLDPEILRPDFGSQVLGFWLAFYWYFVTTVQGGLTNVNRV